MDHLTTDQLSRYDLNIRQPTGGYRFSVDPLLLADFVTVTNNRRVIDLGTGCGVIPLVLARRFPDAHITGVDTNPEMVALAGENVAVNRLQEQISVTSADVIELRRLYKVSRFDAVVANPPFRHPQTGRVSPRLGRDQARHETTAGLADFLAAAKYLVTPAGRIFFVYLTDRLAEFIHTASELNLAILRLRMVHGYLDAPAKIFLVELAKGRKGSAEVLAPLIVYESDGEYTEECRRILTGK